MSKIFIVEDDQLLARMYINAFHAHGYRVQWASDGQDAFDQLDKMLEYPDLIILDVIMPRLNGLQLLQAIKEDLRFKDIPVVMLTGLSGKVSEGEKAIDLGAEMYLVKGEDSIEELCGKIKKILKEQLLK